MTVHLRNPAYPGRESNAVACGEPAGRHTTSPGEVTCFICRKTDTFRAVQLEGVETPTPQPDIPTLLRGVIADCESILALHEQAQRITTPSESEH